MPLLDGAETAFAGGGRSTTCATPHPASGLASWYSQLWLLSWGFALSVLSGLLYGTQSETRAVCLFRECLWRSILIKPDLRNMLHTAQDMDLLRQDTLVAGASAGSLIAACSKSGLSLEAVLEACLELTTDCRVNGTRFRWVSQSQPKRSVRLCFPHLYIVLCIPQHNIVDSQLSGIASAQGRRVYRSVCTVETLPSAAAQTLGTVSATLCTCVPIGKQAHRPLLRPMLHPIAKILQSS